MVGGWFRDVIRTSPLVVVFHIRLVRLGDMHAYSQDLVREASYA